MTPFTIARDELLPYIGILSFDPAVNASTAGKRGATSQDIQICANCMTQAAEEIFNDGPAAISETLYSDALRAPADVTMDLTKYSKTFANFTPAAWMIGCTARISGDDTDNEIINATTLLRPYMGGTATGISAQVFGDSIPLPSTIKLVLDPVRLPTIAPLTGVNNREHFLTYTQPHQYGNRHTSPSVFFSLTNKSVGQPAIWMAENSLDPAQALTAKYVRFNPMPNQDYSATMRVKMKAPVFTVADIYAGTAYTVDPAKAIPLDYHASIFLPMVKKRFMAHPSFSGNPAVIQEIRDGYVQAKRMLVDCTPSVTDNEGLYQ